MLNYVSKQFFKIRLVSTRIVSEKKSIIDWEFSRERPTVNQMETKCIHLFPSNVVIVF